MQIIDIEIKNNIQNTKIMMKRLIAGEGKILVNNDMKTNIIDVNIDDVSLWTEEDLPEEINEDITNDIIDEYSEVE